ncbi:hypothetical protein LCGC14_2684050 [marine sediment metagenome]|uniref:Oligopeptide transport permease C-like N-terminal domain-containing protein n=1 Tax=marine sediment metagenome TaxID=412755 RepID=A0A0F9CC72_9ZZZZ
MRILKHIWTGFIVLVAIGVFIPMLIISVFVPIPETISKEREIIT